MDKNTGWSCPHCNAVYAPTVEECYKCNSNFIAPSPAPVSPEPESEWERWVKDAKNTWRLPSRRGGTYIGDIIPPYTITFCTNDLCFCSGACQN